MKRLILPLALLLTLLATAPLLAVDSSQPPTLIQDVVRMTQGGVADDAIIAFVQNRRGTFAVTADDMIAMADAKVSKDVMKFVADAAATRDQSWREGNADTTTTQKDDRAEETVKTRTVYVPRVYISPFWDPWYYDPFWYGPRLSLNFGFGYYPRYYYGGYRGFYGGYRGGFHGPIHRGRH